MTSPSNRPNGTSPDPSNAGPDETSNAESSSTPPRPPADASSASAPEDDGKASSASSPDDDADTEGDHRGEATVVGHTSEGMLKRLRASRPRSQAETSGREEHPSDPGDFPAARPLHGEQEDHDEEAHSVATVVGRAPDDVLERLRGARPPSKDKASDKAATPRVVAVAAAHEEVNRVDAAVAAETVDEASAAPWQTKASASPDGTANSAADPAAAPTRDAARGPSSRTTKGSDDEDRQRSTPSRAPPDESLERKEIRAALVLLAAAVALALAIASSR